VKLKGIYMNIAAYLLVGLVGGVLSGLLGIGGGIIIIPALVFLFGFSQEMAQGTTLAMMIPPIGIMAAWVYYNKGCVDLKVAGIMCLSFFIGGLLGAKFAVNISGPMLTKVFGVALLLISLKMIFGK
jgi:uncharacterized membrane protein YfcA